MREPLALDREAARRPALRATRAGRGPVARRRPARRSGSRQRSSRPRAAARRPSNSTSAASPCGSGPGTILEREHRQHDRQQGRHERRPVDARLDQGAGITIAATYNLEGDGLRTTHPACGRRGRGAEAAHLPAAQGGLRGGAGARRARGARPPARGQLRPRRARRDAPASSTASTCAARSARAARCRSSCSPPRPRRSTRCSASSSGADDYITKPFSVREFRSRVKAVLRRAALAAAGRALRGAASTRASSRIDFEQAPGDRARRGRSSSPTSSSRSWPRWRAPPGRVFSRTMLLERVWGDASYRDPRTIDVHIRHLREKLERGAQASPS